MSCDTDTPWFSASDHAYEVLSVAPGERCILCGKAGGAKKIRHSGGQVDVLHEDCLVKCLAAPFEVLGPADRGKQCRVCWKAKGAKRIKRGVDVCVLHEDCAPDYFAAHPPIIIPDDNDEPF